MPTTAGDAARIPMTDEAVLALVRLRCDGIDSVYLCPNVPGKKELAARSVHARHLPSDERVLALFDDTVFGLGDDGFLLTSQRLCWKNVGGRPQMIEWRHVDPERMYRDRHQLVLGTGAIEVSGDESIIDACEQAFHVLAFSARVPQSAVARSGVVLSGNADESGRHDAPGTTGTTGDPQERESTRPTFRPSRPAVSHATRPPPHAVSYDSYVVHASSQKSPKFACWQCQTPLHWNTPQCSHCSAWPMPQGWLRTA
ncbi:MAG: hypothetical protein QOI41_2973 [Myxococcales bacterium]|nr:hypothetical protein [Myxococcales bacterium]